MKTHAFAIAVTALGVIAATAAAEAGDRVVTGPRGGVKSVDIHVNETGVSRAVTRTSPYGGVMVATQACAPDLSDCQRAMTATGAYGRSVSGSATVTRAPGKAVVNGSVVGPNGGVYNRTVTRRW